MVPLSVKIRVMERSLDGWLEVWHNCKNPKTKWVANSRILALSSQLERLYKEAGYHA